jgi:hypothetical protein
LTLAKIFFFVMETNDQESHNLEKVQRDEKLGQEFWIKVKIRQKCEKSKHEKTGNRRRFITS